MIQCKYCEVERGGSRRGGSERELAATIRYWCEHKWENKVAAAVSDPLTQSANRKNNSYTTIADDHITRNGWVWAHTISYLNCLICFIYPFGWYTMFAFCYFNTKCTHAQANTQRTGAKSERANISTEHFLFRKRQEISDYRSFCGGGCGWHFGLGNRRSEEIT